MASAAPRYQTPGSEHRRRSQVGSLFKDASSPSAGSGPVPVNRRRGYTPGSSRRQSTMHHLVGGSMPSSPGLGSSAGARARPTSNLAGILGSPMANVTEVSAISMESSFNKSCDQENMALNTSAPIADATEVTEWARKCAELKAQLAGSSAAYFDAETALKASETEKRKLENDLNKERKRMKLLEDKLNDLADAHAATVSRMLESEKETAALAARLNSATGEAYSAQLSAQEAVARAAQSECALSSAVADARGSAAESNKEAEQLRSELASRVAAANKLANDLDAEQRVGAKTKAALVEESEARKALASNLAESETGAAAAAAAQGSTAQRLHAAELNLQEEVVRRMAAEQKLAALESEYTEANGDLKSTADAWQSDFETERAAHAATLAALEAARENEANASEELEDTKEQLRTVQSQLSSQTAKVASLEKNLSMALSNLNLAEQTLEAADNKRACITAELEELREAYATEKATAAHALTRVAELTSELEAARDAAAQAEHKAEISAKLNEGLSRDLREAQADRNGLADRLEKHQSSSDRTNELSAQNKQGLGEQLATAIAQIASLQAEAESREREMKNLRDDVAMARAEAGAADKMVARLRKEKTEAEGAAGKAARDVARLEQALNEERAELQNVAQRYAALEGQTDYIVKAAKQGEQSAQENLYMEQRQQRQTREELDAAAAEYKRLEYEAHQQRVANEAEAARAAEQSRRRQAAEQKLADEQRHAAEQQAAIETYEVELNNAQYNYERGLAQQAADYERQRRALAVKSRDQDIARHAASPRHAVAPQRMRQQQRPRRQAAKVASQRVTYQLVGR